MTTMTNACHLFVTEVLSPDLCDFLLNHGIGRTPDMRLGSIWYLKPTSRSFAISLIWLEDVLTLYVLKF